MRTLLRLALAGAVGVPQSACGGDARSRGSGRVLQVDAWLREAGLRGWRASTVMVGAAVAVLAGEVLHERVAAEVVRRVAPHAVGVVGVVLGVVELDDRDRSLEPVVVALRVLG